MKKIYNEELEIQDDYELGLKKKSDIKKSINQENRNIQNISNTNKIKKVKVKEKFLNKGDYSNFNHYNEVDYKKVFEKNTLTNIKKIKYFLKNSIKSIMFLAVILILVIITINNSLILQVRKNKEIRENREKNNKNTNINTNVNTTNLEKITKVSTKEYTLTRTNTLKEYVINNKVNDLNKLIQSKENEKTEENKVLIEEEINKIKETINNVENNFNNILQEEKYKLDEEEKFFEETTIEQKYIISTDELNNIISVLVIIENNNLNNTEIINYLQNILKQNGEITNIQLNINEENRLNYTINKYDNKKVNEVITNINNNEENEKIFKKYTIEVNYIDYKNDLTKDIKTENIDG